MGDEPVDWGMEDLWVAERAEAASDPKAWRETAVHLIYGAGVLWERHRTAAAELSSVTDDTFPRWLGDIHVGRAAFFLLASGVEAALKAIAVTRNDSLPFDKASQFSSGHNLLALAPKHCGLSLTKDEESVLKRLEHWIMWAGRYPTPRVDKEKAPVIGFPVEEFSDLPESLDPKHWDAAWAFVNKLMNCQLQEPKR